MFIVKEGQFEVTKTLPLREDPSAALRQIFINPLRANKVVSSNTLNHTKKTTKIPIYVKHFHFIIFLYIVVSIRKGKHHWRGGPN